MQAIRRSFLSLHNDPALKVLLEEDKDVIKAANSLSHEISETSKFTVKFGETQHFDLKDILENFGNFSLELGKSLKDISIAYDGYREKLKELKKMQDGLNDLETKSKAAAEKFKKAKAGNKPFDMLERDAEEAHAEVLKYVAKFEGVKRALIKEAMLIQYQGWGDLGQKVYFRIDLSCKQLRYLESILLNRFLRALSVQERTYRHTLVPVSQSRSRAT